MARKLPDRRLRAAIAPVSEVLEQRLFLSSVAQSNSDDVVIPDNGDWVYSTIHITNVPAGATITDVDAYFDIKHTFAGDLVVDLEVQNSPANHNLWNREGEGQDNPSQTVDGIDSFDGLDPNRIWYLYARDFEAGDSGRIDSWSITIHYEVPVQPPGAATGLTPNDTTVTTLTPSLDWSDVSNAASYEVNISKFPYGSSNIVYTSSGITSSSHTVLNNYLTYGTDYRWDVTAINSGGSTTSANAHFTTGSAPLAAPTNLSVSGNDDPLDLTPMLEWDAAQGALSYEVNIAPVGGNIIHAQQGISATSYEVPTGVLSSGMQYVWDVTSERGTEERTSADHNFTTPLLPAPTLLSPANDSTNQPATSQFDWSQVTGNLGYRIVIATSTSALPTDPNDTGTFGDDVPVNITRAQDVTTYTPPAGTLAADTTYYWKVHALGPTGGGAWSSANSFTVAAVVPLAAPTNLSVSGNSDPFDLTPTLSWDAAQGAVTYEVNIARVGGSIIHTQEGISSASYQVPDAVLVPGALYVWDVTSERGTEERTSVNHNFTTPSVTATGADLVVQGAVSASPNPAAAGSNITVAYELWNAGTGNAAASTTKVQIKRSSDNALLKEETFAVNGVSAGAIASISHEMALPSTAAAGLYNVFVILDNYSRAGQTAVAEANDDNAFTNISIQQSTAPVLNVNDRVTATERLNVRDAAASITVLVTQNPGEKGRIVSEPQTASYFGTTYTWYEVAWDDGYTGWSVQNYLGPAPDTGTPSDPTGLVDAFITSPNFESRPAGAIIDAIVIHTTEASYQSTVNGFTNSATEKSAHYIIESDGRITQAVHPDSRAWHANYYNDRSIGIEMVGYANHAATWTKANLAALRNLVAALTQKYPGIPVVHPTAVATDYGTGRLNVAGIIGHYQIQPIQGEFDLKTDPGPYFPWVEFVNGLSPRDQQQPTISSTASVVMAGIQSGSGVERAESLSSFVARFDYTLRDFGNSVLDQLDVLRRGFGGAWEWVRSVFIPGSVSQHQGTIEVPLDNGGQTEYTLRVRDSAGNVSNGSNVHQLRTPVAEALSFQFPLKLNDWTPFTAPIVSVFDHTMRKRFDPDPNRQGVTAYTGETGTIIDLVESEGFAYPSFKAKDNDGNWVKFLVNGSYTGTGKTGPSTLNYDAHPGYDYKVPEGIDVYAAAAGTVADIGSDNNAGIWIRLEHFDGTYQTQYLHLQSIATGLAKGTTVTKGQHIGKSGKTGGVSPHLHFEVKKYAEGPTGWDWWSVDPYGWFGRGPDPAPIANVPLWDALYGTVASHLPGLAEDFDGGFANSWAAITGSAAAEVRSILAFDSRNAAVQFTKGSDAAIQRSVVVPSANPVLQFDYRFARVGITGDRLAVLVNGSEVWSASGTEGQQTAFQSSGEVDLSAYAGQTVQLEIRLATNGPSSGEDQAQVWIDNVIIESGGSPLDMTTVQIVPRDTTASELGADPGAFRIVISLPEAPAAPVVVPVSFAIGGTATSGADYWLTEVGSSEIISDSLASITVTIPTTSNTTWKEFTLKPRRDALAEPVETAIFAIQPSDNYTIEPPEGGSLTISVHDGPTAPAATVSKTVSAPVIDGVMEPTWAGVAEHRIQRVVYGAIGSPADLSGTWRAMWDASALYYYVRIDDEAQVNDSTEIVWDDDAVEVYLDPDHSSLPHFDRINDVQYGFRWNDLNVHISSVSAAETVGVQAVHLQHASGYSMEIAIPWTSLKVTPAAGMLMGMEVAILDDDDEGGVDAKVQWFGPRNQAWGDPNTFASVALAAPLELSAQLVQVQGDELWVYPGLDDSGLPVVHRLDTVSGIRVLDGHSAVLHKPGGGLIDLPPVTLGESSRLSLPQDGDAPLRLSRLTFAADAVLDLAGNDLILQCPDDASAQSALALLRDAIRSGRNSGSWSGPGLISSAAVANPLTGLAAVRSSGLETFAGQAVSLNDILVKYTYNGDANLDGMINADDYFRIDSGFIEQLANPTYRDGDFNYDGKVNADDYFLIDSAFLGQGAPLASSTPATVTLVTSTARQKFAAEPQQDRERKRSVRPIFFSDQPVSVLGASRHQSVAGRR